MSFFSMPTSERGLFPAILLGLILVVSEPTTAEASGRHRLPTSKGGITVPITPQEIGQAWCKTKPIRQTIRKRGCESKMVENNMCYGQCRSFYIPIRKGAFESCSFCTPVNSTTLKVVLNCPTRKIKKVVKNVKIITECSCRVCASLRYI